MTSRPVEDPHMDNARDANGNVVSANAVGAMVSASNGFSTVLSVDDPRPGRSKIKIDYFTTDLPTGSITAVHLLATCFSPNAEDQYPILVLTRDEFTIVDSWHAHEEVVSDLMGQTKIWIHETSNDGSARAYNVPLLRTVYAQENGDQVVIHEGPFASVPGTFVYTSFGLESV